MNRIIIGLLLLLSGLFSQNAQSTGFAVLKLPLTAWQTALGEQLTLGEDASWTNPSLLTNSNSVTFLINHEKWLSDVNTNFIGIQIPMGDWRLSAQYFISQVDGIEIRTAPTEEPLTYGDAHFQFGKLAIGYLWNKQLSFGIAAKILSEKIYYSWNQGVAFDISAQYQMERMPISMSLLIANLGSTNKLLNEETQLPLLLAVGVKYNTLELTKGLLFNVVSELKMINSYTTKFSLGSEFSVYNVIYIQTGYIFNDTFKHFAAGLQIKWNKMRFGIGWLPMDSDFADKTSFTFNVEF